MTVRQSHPPSKQSPLISDAFIRWEDEINCDIEQQIQIFGVNMLSIMLFSSLLNLSVAEETVADPYLWLEGVEDQKALEWVTERNNKSVDTIAKTEEFKSLESKLRTIYDSTDRIPYVYKQGDMYYNFCEMATIHVEYGVEQTLKVIKAMPHLGRPFWIWMPWPPRKMRIGCGTVQIVYRQ